MESLLRAVLKDPADDDLRLVVADWLDDRGDFDRAEFIRAQCGRGDPARIGRLIEVHGTEWAGDPLNQIAGAEFCFTRGFVSIVRVRRAQWGRYGRRLVAMHPLEHVELSNGRLDWNRCLQCRGVGRVERASMDANMSFRIERVACQACLGNGGWVMCDGLMYSTVAEAKAGRSRKLLEEAKRDAGRGDRVGAWHYAERDR